MIFHDFSTSHSDLNLLVHCCHVQAFISSDIPGSLALALKLHTSGTQLTPESWRQQLQQEMQAARKWQGKALTKSTKQGKLEGFIKKIEAQNKSAETEKADMTSKLSSLILNFYTITTWKNDWDSKPVIFCCMSLVQQNSSKTTTGRPDRSPSDDGHPRTVTRSTAQPLDHDAQNHRPGRPGQPGFGARFFAAQNGWFRIISGKHMIKSLIKLYQIHIKDQE